MIRNMSTSPADAVSGKSSLQVLLDAASERYQEHQRKTGENLPLVEVHLAVGEDCSAGAGVRLYAAPQP
jgi:hypothetical protein